MMSAKWLVVISAVFAAVGVRAEETEPVVNLVVDAGESLTLVGTNEYNSITVKGDLTVTTNETIPYACLHLTNTVTKPPVALAGGHLSVFGSLAVVDGPSTASKVFVGTTFSQGDDGAYGRLTLDGSGKYYTNPVKISAPTTTVTGLSDEGYFDFLELRDGGAIWLRTISNSSTLTGRVTVAGSGGTIYTQSGWDASARFYSGAFVVQLEDGAAFNFNVSNQHGTFNTKNVPVLTTGDGDISLLAGAYDYPLAIRSGAYFNHTGKLMFGRSNQGSSSTCNVRFDASDILGPDLEGLYYTPNGSVKGEAWVGLNTGVTLTVKNAKLSNGGTSVLYGPGTLQVGADAGTSEFSVEKVFTNNVITVEKIGSNEMTLNVKGGFVTNGWLSTLKLSGGTVRIVSNLWLDTLDPNGGTFVVEDGKTLCIASGLAGFTGTLNPPSGDMWDDGDHVICYYKGDDPDFTQWQVPLGTYQAASFKAEEIVDETSAYVGYKKVTLTVAESVKEITISESGDCDLAGTMSTMTEKMLVVTVAEGVAATNTTALTGAKALRVKGAGTLTLAASSPDYSGYVDLQGISKVYVTSDTPFGTGKVLLEEGSRRIVFANTASAITVPNDIEIESDSAGVFTTITAAVEKITFTGAITAPNGLSLSATYSADNWKNKNVIFSFTGSVDVNAGNFTLSGYGFCEVHGPLVAEMVYASGGGSPEGTAKIYLYDSANRIGTLQCRWAGGIYACGEEAFGGGVFTATNGKKFAYGISGGSYDQHMQAFNGGVDSGQTIANEATLTATAASTLTFTGGVATATAMRVAVKGALNLKVDADGLTQTFQGGKWTTTGAVSVEKGTLVMKDCERSKDGTLSTNYITCTSVSALSVGSAGRLEFAGKTDSAFAAAQTVTVDGGALAFTGEGELPFGTQKATSTALALTNGGTLEIAAGKTVAVKTLTLDGTQLLPSGDYTGEGGPAGATVLSNLTGTGILSVRLPKGLMLLFR